MQAGTGKRAIYLTARDCRGLFERALKASSSSSSTQQYCISTAAVPLVREYQNRFDAWTTFSGVFARDNASLDHKLRNHPGLYDMILRLLNIIRRNIFLVGVDERNETPQASSRTYGVVGDSIAGNIQPSTVNIALRSIEESITRLNKLAITIRLSSRSTLTARARTFAYHNPELVQLSEFEDRACLALQTLYPSASKGLRQRLVDTMGDRYSRIRYEFYRMGRFQTSSDPYADPPTPSGHNQENPVDPITKLCNEQEDITAPVLKGKITVPKFPSSSIDTSRLNEHLKTALATTRRSKAPKTLAAPANQHREPPLPRYENNGDYTHCEWCFQIIDHSLIHTREDGSRGWSEEGRCHYKNDLQPYVCIAESCSKLRPSYSSSGDWFDHMTSTHSEYWAQVINDESLLTCPVEHENDSNYLFSTLAELYNHNFLHHNHQESLGTEEDDEYITRQYGVETSSLAKRAKLSVDSATSPDRVETSWAMGSHIAEHLQYIAILSLQLISAMNGEPYGYTDGDSATNTLESDVSGPCDHLENDFDDLLSEQQAPSTVWSDVDEFARRLALSEPLSDNDTSEVHAENLSICDLWVRTQLEPDSLLRPHILSPKPVHFVSPEIIGDCQKVLAEARTVLKRHGIPLSDNPSNAFFRVHIINGNFTIRDNQDCQLQNPIPPLPIHAECVAENLVQCITHLTKYYTIRELSNPVKSCSVEDEWVSITLKERPYGFPTAPWLGLSSRLGKTPQVMTPVVSHTVCEATEGGWLLLQLDNISQEGLFVVIVDLDQSWSVTQIYPPAPRSGVVEADNILYLPLQFTAPGYATGITDTLKIIVTTQSSRLDGLRYLELPELDTALAGAIRPDHLAAEEYSDLKPGSRIETLKDFVRLAQSRSTPLLVYIPTDWDTATRTIKVSS
ncbi:hypothetical protein TWF481_006072 [Arthrobotrys musiformis]|uniref:Uncharacterized protein n=1 Tax=Arthrobotrys musiformis TaxID=47236 RepID=A0AAV9WGL5_9PEZI